MFFFATFSLIFFLNIHQYTCSPCALKEVPLGYVCVCNETYCDSLEDIILPGPEYYVIASSSKGGLRLNSHIGKIEPNNKVKIYVQDQFPEINSTGSYSVDIFVDSQKTYQKIIGFGGAFTGAVSWNLQKMPQILQDFAYKSYYSKTYGIAYNMMRMTIGGCDFDLYPWTYAEYPVNDTTLSGFTHLNAEDMQKIGQIKQLHQVTGNYDVKKFAAAWSSPRWMKSNNEWTGKSHILKEYYQTWADYYLRWLTLMDKENMTFWGISTGNEPLSGYTDWRLAFLIDLGWTAQNQGKWVAENLGPLIRSSKFKDINIIGYDDDRNALPFWLNQMNVGNEQASSYINGVGVHWYYDSIIPASYNVDFHNQYPDKFFLNTESCIIYVVTLGDWSDAEQYITDMFTDLSTWVQGWIDWNLLLSDKGGPNYLGHNDNAGILVNTTTFNEFYKNPQFYAFGQFSRFLEPDSVRIDVTSSVDTVQAIGFKRPDNSIVVIFYNSINQPANVHLHHNNKNFEISVPAKSIHSIAFYD